MPKIVQIKDDIAMIGMDDGSLKEVRSSDLGFEACVGDLVDVFENDNSVVVTKQERIQPATAQNGGININVSNENNANPAPVYVANRKKVVNKVAYCLLALFLGGLGVHKFYSGRIGLGIVYILFCWTFIPLFISLIECIIALFKTADVNGNILI